VSGCLNIGGRLDRLAITAVVLAVLEKFLLGGEYGQIKNFHGRRSRKGI